MKTGLVMEGGSMRGMFTAGVLDVFMENGVDFDGAVGVSAGAVFGCNFKSRQPGRVIRYNKKYCRDPRYASMSSLVKTGNVFGTDFCYRAIPDFLDPFDKETYEKNPMPFYVVCTDALSGNPVYHKCDTWRGDDQLWMRASASMPALSEIVRVGGRLLSDGGTADSIPLKFFENIGYRRNVVILTQPEGFVKEKNRMLPLLRLSLRKYPNLIEALETRHIRYNETTAYIKQRVKSGAAFVIQPEAGLNIKSVVHDPDELERVYQFGRKAGVKNVDAVREFLRESKTLN